MPRFGAQYRIDGQPCRPEELMGHAELPNCDDPVFRAWCAACNLEPGNVYDWKDARMQKLQRIIQDPSYDPWQDTADDYLDPF